jgi:protein SCO1/2
MKNKQMLLLIGAVSIALGLFVGLAWRVRATDFLTSLRDQQAAGLLANDQSRLLQDFTLTNQDDRPMNLSDLRGKPALLIFAFTNCPDVCPLGLSDFRRVKRELSDAGSVVNFVMISVDGERDTPERLKSYLGQFDPQFIGLTGPPGSVEPIAALFGARFESLKSASNPNNYSVSHTSFTYLVDGYGRLRKTYAFQSAPAGIAADIRTLLDEPPPQDQSAITVSYNPKPIYMSAPAPLPDFALVDQRGRAFTTRDLPGQATLMYFGATECLDTQDCANVLNQLRTVQSTLGPDKYRVRFLMISVDSERDTPERLSGFIEREAPGFIALTGDPRDIATLSVRNGVHVETRPGQGGAITRRIAHPAYSMLLDEQGRWVLSFPTKLSADEIVNEMRKVLRWPLN